MTRRPRHPIVGLVAIAALSLACVAAPVPGPSSSTTATATTVTTGPEQPSATPSLDVSGLDETTALAVQIRASWGLRRDLAFINQVAHDPTATSEFGTPLLPAEVAEINHRSEAADAIVPIVQGYASANVAVFGGIWIDQAAGGVVTLSFTDDLVRHRLALADLLAGKGVVKIVQARYPESVMRALQERITDDAAWFRTIPAALKGVGYDTIGNVVAIEISTANPDVAALIVSRFAVPADALRVESDGTGIALEPWGKIKGRVVDVPAKTLVELSINYHGDRIGADCGSEVGLGLTPAGTFELPCQGGHWIIEAGRTIDDVVARGEVDLKPGGTASVTLRPVAP